MSSNTQIKIIRKQNYYGSYLVILEYENSVIALHTDFSGEISINSKPVYFFNLLLLHINRIIVKRDVFNKK